MLKKILVGLLLLSASVPAWKLDSRGGSITTLGVGGTEYVACGGVDTAYSDTIKQAGNPFHSVELWGTGDSVNVIVDMLISNANDKEELDSVDMVVGYDRNGSQTWSVIATWTLGVYTSGTRELYSVPLPPCEWFCYRVRNATAAKNGPTTQVHGRIKISP